MILKIGNVKILGGQRESLMYYPGPVIFNLSPGNARNQTAAGSLWNGPVYIGYQNPCPYLEMLGDFSLEINNVLDLILASQLAYTSIERGSLVGPFAPVFYWANWDSAQYGAINTFGWDGPDPNTFWAGFQYRTFENIANFWHQLDIDSLHQVKAEEITTSFLSWLDAWLIANPTEASIATTFSANNPPAKDYNEPHMVALALKATVYAWLAGANAPMCKRVALRLIQMLRAMQVIDGDMRGSFSQDPVAHQFYGYWCGEIADALALFKQNITILS